MDYKYYCEVNASCFKQNALTISEENIKCFINNFNFNKSDLKKITILFNKKEYILSIRYNKRDKNKGGSYYQLRWEKEFNEALSRVFIYSYINTYYKGKKSNKDEQKEIMVFKRKNKENKVSLFPVNQIKNTQFDNLFIDLFEKNYFGLIDTKDKEHIITYNSPWYDRDEIKKYSNESFVIYYLIDVKNKKLYIGKTKKIGSRFKNERDEIPKWNKFRYDKVDPNYYYLLERIEHHTIGAFMFFMKNNLRHSKKNKYIELSDYTLVNKIQYN